ncbi:ArsR/SmtB family transcription factor [Taibaiella koreensis]|uniref:ArsR/SmtB family transcription factor n=1 Tax=Taibaiella koreensis TaxID=1268548 RepID=UPI000E59CAFF|nr:metalloregulator ArsR/SmtB family transcription factor [Taibaiella koreensis]
MRRDVFQAIADPNRRAIIDLLARQSLTLNEVADHFDISRPAVSKHVKILTECGLIVIRQQGRERYCTADFRQLGEVSDWVGRYHAFWSSKLDALGRFLEQDETAASPKKNWRKQAEE